MHIYIHTQTQTYIHARRRGKQKHPCAKHHHECTSIRTRTYIHTCIHTYIHARRRGKHKHHMHADEGSTSINVLSPTITVLIACIHTCMHTYTRRQGKTSINVPDLTITVLALKELIEHHQGHAVADQTLYSSGRPCGYTYIYMYTLYGMLHIYIHES